MASTADISIRPTSGTLAAAIDRWIYVFMAGLFVQTVLAGFIPSSIGKVGMVMAGIRPPFPIALHVHAVLMGSWLLLLLTQAWLMTTGRTAPHRQLGIVGAVLVPAIVAAGLVLVPTTYHGLLEALRAPPPGLEAPLQQARNDLTNILLFQIRAGIVVPLLVVWALLARRTDSEVHKRLMILATAVPLPAGVDRIPGMSAIMPAYPLGAEVEMLLCVVPMFGWDLIRLGRIHRAYLIWIGANLPFVVGAVLLWNSKWWFAFVPRLMGVG